jgi:hypothetical protein
MTSTMDVFGSTRPTIEALTKSMSTAPTNTAPAHPAAHQATDDHVSLSDAPSAPQVFTPLEARPEGMPSLAVDYPRMPRFKRYLSEKVFYMPMALAWAALALRYGSVTLPTSANPSMDAGGLWGESKIQCMSILGAEAMAWTAPFLWVENGDGSSESQRETVHRTVTAMRKAGHNFPIVAKPDLGYQGWGVRRIDSLSDLRAYLETYPAGQRLMLQQLVPYEGEAGIFYVRRPGEDRGRIYSMALVYYPHVIGDGHSTLERLIDADPWLLKAEDEIKEANRTRLNWIPALGETVRLTFCGSYRLGAVYRDARDHVTDALSNRIEAICRDIPGFYFGRFDIRFKSLEALKRGEDFRILEINGAGAEVLHIWDGKTTLRRAYHDLLRQYGLLFRIAADNRALGHKPVGIWGMIKRQRQQEKLRAVYPSSN